MADDTRAPASAAQAACGAGGADILALGFGTCVAMWGAGFFCRLPTTPIGQDLNAPPSAADLSASASVPNEILLAALVLIFCAGCFLAGRLTARGWRGGLYVGLLVSALNLFILAGVVSSAADPAARTAWLIFIPGTLLAGGVLGALAAAVGARTRPEARTAPERAPTPDATLESARLGPALLAEGEIAAQAWRSTFALVAAAATLLLIIIGGLVTGFKAGLAVPDWPNSFGSMMFLYPLTKMTGGIYFEHSHRLLGSLVGLTYLVLAALVWWTETRRGVRGLALGLLLAVAIQGLLGGLRVTGTVTFSVDRSVLQPNIWLAAVHGVAGQLLFGAAVALAALLTPGWRNGRHRAGSRVLLEGQWLVALLLSLLFLQLVAGAVLRHTAGMAFFHVSNAILVLVVGLAVGTQAWVEGARRPVLRRAGKVFLALLSFQIVLGMLSAFALGVLLERRPSLLWQVGVTSGHQTVGALLLAYAVWIAVWMRA